MLDALLGLAENAALPPDLLDRLIARADAELAATIAERPHLSDAQIAALAHFEAAAIRLARDGRRPADDVDPVTQPLVALAALDAGHGRPEWTYQLAADPQVYIREKLAECRALPPDVLEALAADPDVRVVAELALWAPRDIAGRLAAHPHAEVRRSAAVNAATPPPMLASLLTGEGLPPARACTVCDQEPVPFVHAPNCDRPGCALPPGAFCDGSHGSTVSAIQQGAVGNPATPAEAAERFADHPSTLIRVTLAERTDLSEQTYVRLATDPVPWVRATLAANPAIGERLIRTLAADRGHDVQRRLAHHPEVPLDVLSELAAATRIGPVLLPRVASAAPHEVEQLAASKNPAVRMLLAQRRDLPPEIRDALAEDPDAKVAKSVAPHPGLSDAQLRAMVARHGTPVIAQVAANPDAPAELLEDLTRHQPPARKAFRQIARHPHATATALLACLTDSRARALAARRSALPPAVIVDLLADDDGQVAAAAAANPSLPYAVMSDLIP